MTEAKIVFTGENQVGPAAESVKRTLSGVTQQYEMSAKQMAAALRGVPAQFTDIVVSLQSGQKPLTVLLQQGGQLKDMFGGVMPAAKALGGFLLTLINPVTILAGAAGALFIAFAEGAKESQELNKVLIMTGDYAGKSADQLNQSAKAIAALAGSTRGAAADALVEVVGSGKIAASQMERVSAAAIEMSRATGRSVKEIVAEFVQLGEDPAKASAKLNEQYHYLTESVYEQIKALEKQGAIETAAATAQGALADAYTPRAKKVQDNLGYLQVAWNSVAKEAKKAWDAMLNLGRDQTGSEQLESLKKQLEIRQSRGPLNPQMADAWTKGNQALQAQIALIERLNVSQAQQAKQEGANAKAQTEGIAAAERVAKLQEEAKGQSAVNRELERYHQDLQRIRAVNPNSADLDPKAIKATEESIRKRFQGDSATKLDQALDAQIKALQGQLQQEEAAVKVSLDQIKTDYDVGLLTTKQFLDKQYEAKQQSLEREFAIAKKQEELARGKQNVAAAEQYKNEQKKILDQMVANAVTSDNALTELNAKAKRAVDAYNESLVAQVRTRQSGIDDALAGAGLSDRARQQQLTLDAARREYDQKSEDLRKQRQKGEANGGISEDVYQGELADLKGYYAARLAQEQDYNAKSDALRSDWTLGAKKAYADYADAAKDAAGQAGKLFTDAMQGMEDALVTFATTGKLSFKTLANSIIGDIARMEAKALVSKVFGGAGGGGGLLGSVLGMVGGGGGGPGAGFSSDASLLSYVTALGSAKGNVFQTPGLSAYSNSIVNRPTVFAFAHGAGLMGEAGPEAIMPLKRGPDGRLGVSSGGDGAMKLTIVNNTSARIDKVTERVVGPGERALIIQEMLAAHVAQLGDANSKSSKAIATNFNVGRRR